MNAVGVKYIKSLYKDDGRLKMAQSLREQHPDVATVTWKWGRWQHVVDYEPFKTNRLVKIPGLEIAPGVNKYGMTLRRFDKSQEAA